MTMTTTMDMMTAGVSNGGGCLRLFQSTAHVARVMGDATYDRRHRIERGGDENITINHGCGGGDCGGGSNSGGDNGGGREQADDDGDDEDDDGSYG